MDIHFSLIIPAYNAEKICICLNSLLRLNRNDLCKNAFVEHELMVNAICGSNLLTRHKNLFLSALSFSFYRSEYTVLAEMDRLSMAKSKKEELNRLIC